MKPSPRLYAFSTAFFLCALGACTPSVPAASFTQPESPSASSAALPAFPWVFDLSSLPEASHRVSGYEQLALPFSLHTTEASSVAGAAEITTEGAPALTLENSWSMGGDFSEILSFPMDQHQVFGSASERPDDLYSYAPAFITPNGHSFLTPPPSSASTSDYMEPQDGQSHGEWVIWKSVHINSSEETARNIDLWKIQAWNRTTQTLTTVASSTDLSEHPTLRIGGEITPSFHASEVYFSTALPPEAVTSRGQLPTSSSLIPLLMRFTLPQGQQKTHVDFLSPGSFPAAIESGLLAATPASVSSPDVLNRLVSFPSEDLRRQGRQPSALFTLSEGWTITGVAASGSHRLCVISPTNPAELSSYIGLWDEESGSAQLPTRWIRVLSPTPVVSLAGDTLAWGAGSQQENAQMYVMRWQDTHPLLAGNAPGYSRPALSPSGRTVAIPRVSQSSATSWMIGEFLP